MRRASLQLLVWLSALALLTLALPTLASASVGLDPYIASASVEGDPLWTGWVDDGRVLVLTMGDDGLLLLEYRLQDGGLAPNRSLSLYGPSGSAVEVGPVAWDPPLLVVAVGLDSEWKLLVVDVGGWSVGELASLQGRPLVSVQDGLVALAYSSGGSWLVDVLEPGIGALWSVELGGGVRWMAWETGRLTILTGDGRLLVYTAGGDLLWSLSVSSLAGPGAESVSLAPGPDLAAVLGGEGGAGWIAVVDLENGSIAYMASAGLCGGARAVWLDGERLLYPAEETSGACLYRVAQVWWREGWENRTLTTFMGPPRIVGHSGQGVVLAGDRALVVVNTTHGTSRAIEPGEYVPGLAEGVGAVALSPSGYRLAVAGGGSVAVFRASALHLHAGPGAYEVYVDDLNETFTLGTLILWLDQPDLTVAITPRVEPPPHLGPSLGETAEGVLAIPPASVGSMDLNETYLSLACTRLVLEGFPNGSVALVEWYGGSARVMVGEGTTLWLAPAVYQVIVEAPPPGPCIGCEGNVTLLHTTVHASPGGALTLESPGYEGVLGTITVVSPDYPVRLRVEGEPIGDPVLGVQTFWALPGVYRVELEAFPLRATTSLWPQDKGLVAVNSTVTVVAGESINLTAPAPESVFPVLGVEWLERAGDPIMLVRLHHVELGVDYTMGNPGNVTVYPGTIQVYITFRPPVVSPYPSLLAAEVRVEGPGFTRLWLNASQLLASVTLRPALLGGIEAPTVYTLHVGEVSRDFSVRPGETASVRVAVPLGATLHATLEAMVPAGTHRSVVVVKNIPFPPVSLELEPGSNHEPEPPSAEAVIVRVRPKGYITEKATATITGETVNTTVPLGVLVERPLLYRPGVPLELHYKIPARPWNIPLALEGSIDLPTEPGEHEVVIRGMAKLILLTPKPVVLQGPNGLEVRLGNGFITLILPPGEYYLIMDGQVRARIELAPGDVVSLALPFVEHPSWAVILPPLAVLLVLAIAAWAWMRRRRQQLYALWENPRRAMVAP